MKKARQYSANFLYFQSEKDENKYIPTFALLTMASIDLRQLTSENQYDGGLAYYSKRRDIAGMTARMADGACPSSLSNILHYYPEYLPDALMATEPLSENLRGNAIEILGAIDEHFDIGQHDLVLVWKCRHAAISALNSVTLAEAT